MKNTLLFPNSTNILVRLLTVNMKNCLTQKSENVRKILWKDVADVLKSSEITVTKKKERRKRKSEEKERRRIEKSNGYG